eukprot:1885583-Rhodomonas_salina.1
MCIRDRHVDLRNVAPPASNVDGSLSMTIPDSDASCNAFITQILPYTPDHVFGGLRIILSVHDDCLETRNGVSEGQRKQINLRREATLPFASDGRTLPGVVGAETGRSAGTWEYHNLPQDLTSRSKFGPKGGRYP